MQNFEYKIKSIEKSVKLTKILIQQMANFNSNKSKKLLEKWYWKILEIIIIKKNKIIKLFMVQHELMSVKIYVLFSFLD